MQAFYILGFTKGKVLVIISLGVKSKFSASNNNAIDNKTKCIAMLDRYSLGSIVKETLNKSVSCEETGSFAG